MREQFRGTINVDIRDSEPDWAPFEPPKAPPGAPNVLYIVLDDVGFSAMSCYGGPIDTPNIDRIAQRGVRYTQFHTTALCSPTRSCLLTGRNHTRNSMACITEAAIGFPNASGTIPPENGMLSEILGELGWNTYMVGKWHLCPTDEMNLAATRRNWPTGRGFERWYGFLGAETNQWYPDLVYDNHPVAQPRTPEEGYHLTEDITDKAIEFIQDAKAIAPEKPFFLYYAPGACQAPHSRAEGVDRQVQGPLRHGVRGDPRTDPRTPKGARARPRQHRAPADQPDRHARTHGPGPDGLPFPAMDATLPWDSLGEDERRLFCRFAEVYAGFLAHADDQIGRLLDYLERTDQLENTLIVLVSDNGASGEGGPTGSVNEMKFANGVADDLAENLAKIDDLGSEKTYNHYPNGWAMAFNTPFKMWKRYEFNGGTSDPLILAWPGGKGGGELREQYCHAIDVVPTILDLLGVDAPETIKGHTQSAFDGRSLRATIDDSSAPSPRTTQFYAMLGSRSIWHEGWKAVTNHPASPAGGTTTTTNGSSTTPTSTARSYTTWRRSIPRRSASSSTSGSPRPARTERSPLDDRSALEILNTERPQLSAPRTRYVYYPDTAPVPEWQGVVTRGRSFVIGAVVDIPAPGAEGVLFAQGTRFGGHSLYVKDNRLHYLNNYLGTTEQKVVATEDLPTGEKLLSPPSFEKTGAEPDGTTGTVTLYHGDHAVGEGEIKTQLGAFAIAGSGPLHRAARGRAAHRRLPRRPAAPVHRRDDRPGWGRRQR
jgi:arylsulfatase